MSVRVDLAELAEQLGSFGFAYLLSVGEDQRPRAVAVRPELVDGVLRVGGIGRRTRENLVLRPAVSLVWPPAEEGGYSLIVDASATVSTDGADLAPVHAVLHRPADHASGEAAPLGAATGCDNDCVPLEHVDR